MEKYKRDGNLAEWIKKIIIEINEHEIEYKGEGKEGQKTERNNIIKEMLKKNMAIDLIAEVTHSSKNNILKIAKS